MLLGKRGMLLAGPVRGRTHMDYKPTRWPQSPRVAVRCAARASNGPNHLELRGLQNVKAFAPVVSGFMTLLSLDMFIQVFFIRSAPAPPQLRPAPPHLRLLMRLPLRPHLLRPLRLAHGGLGSVVAAGRSSCRTR